MTFGRSVLLLLHKSVKLLDEQPNVCPCGPLAPVACSHCMNVHHQFQVTKLWELCFVGEPTGDEWHCHCVRSHKKLIRLSVAVASLTDSSTSESLFSSSVSPRIAST